MPMSRPALHVMLAAVLVGLLSLTPLHGADKQTPTLKDSATARAATTKHDKDIKAAQQDFGRKLRALRQEYEAKTKSSRKAYVAALKAALAEETKKGNLELAVAIKEAVAKLESEAPAVWPADSLPVVVAAGEEPDGDNAGDMEEAEAEGRRRGRPRGRQANDAGLVEEEVRRKGGVRP